MKGFLIILLISTSFTALAQQPLSEIAFINEPIRSIQLAQSEAVSRAQSSFKNLQIPIQMMNTFRRGNIMVSFQDVNLPCEISLERFYENTYHHAESDLLKKIKVTGQIRQYKFEQFYVRTTQKGDENFYWFISESKKLRAIEGCVAYKDKDEKRANLILNDLLNSINLK